MLPFSHQRRGSIFPHLKKKHNPLFLSIRPNEGLTFEPSALETI